MKKIKIIGVIVLVFSLTLGGYLLFKKEDYSYYLALGDYISKDQVIANTKIVSFSNYVGEKLVKEKEVNNVNTSYLKNNMTSKKLLEMIEKDIYSLEETSLVDLIKKSKYITITLGLNDVINQIKYDTNKQELIYDKEIIENKIEVFKHNYYQIVEEIKDLNDEVNVVLVGNYKIYNNFEVSNQLNEAIKQVSDECEVYYVSLEDLKDDYMFNDNALYLNTLGQEVISDKVLATIGKNKEI